MGNNTMNQERVHNAAAQHGYRTVRVLEHTGSTNDDARQVLTDPNPSVREQLGELSVFATDDQRAGHGHAGDQLERGVDQLRDVGAGRGQ